MDDQEFKRLLDLFPLVRSRDYCDSEEDGLRSILCGFSRKKDDPFSGEADEDSSGQSTSQLARDSLVKELQDPLAEVEDSEPRNAMEQSDAFWGKLLLAAERKVGAAEAERFCKSFQQLHRKLVYEELTLDAAQKFINSSKRPSE